MSEDKTPVRLIEVVDDKTRDLIFKVKQQLEDILDEVDSKLDSAQDAPEQYEPELIAKFKILHQETEHSLATINNIVEVYLDEGIDIEQYRQENSEQFTQFAEELESFVTQVTEILSKF